MYANSTKIHSVLNERQRLPFRKQTGQAILLILQLTVAAVISLSLVNMGIMTSEKIQLQNAADASTYSISTVEARDLSFSEYTNRAMVANEVALGQMVGLMSHADMIGSAPPWLNEFFMFTGVYAVPVLGTFTQRMVEVQRGFLAKTKLELG